MRALKYLAVPFLAAILIFIYQDKALAAPPANFETETLISSGLTSPTGFDFAPDGRIFIVEQDGTIRIYKNDVLLPQFFDQLPGYATGDNGLLGIAFDPDWNTNHYVYFYYVDDTDLSHRVVRFDASGDIGKDGPVEIYNSHAMAGFNHAGGTIEFGPDGKLYISIGDAGVSTNAQDLTVPMGKVMRINKDGSIPTDNPFINTPGARPEIWAYGFRNPFRFQFDSASGKLYEGDVGESTWEEVNIVTKGGNYGWPNVEGICTSNCAGYVDPIYVYHHDTDGYAVAGGPVYHGTNFPASFDGDYFFGDYAQQFIKYLTFDSSGKVTGAQDFEPDAGAVTDLKVGPDGSLYYLDIYPGELHRITYNATGVKAPTSVPVADKMTGLSPLAVNFTNTSSDPQGLPLSYSWNFGDGASSTAANPSHTYDAEGVYMVTLATSNGSRTTVSAPLEIDVGTPPTLTIDSPTEGMLYKAGDAITYSAHATDENGKALPDSAFSRYVVLHHTNHIHPFLRPTPTSHDTFVIPTTGEPSADTYYEIITTVTAPNGLSTTKSVNIRPIKVNLSFSTSPAGLSINLDGQPLVTPTTIQGVVGFTRTLDGPPTQELNGTTYEFDHWSDGGPETHTVSTPSSDTSYTAYFRAGTPFTAEFFNNITLSGTPVLTRNDATIDFDWSNGSPDSSVNADQFSARWSKDQYFSGGVYTFTATSDDGERLFIDGNAVIDQWVNRPQTTNNADVTLEPGTHNIRYEYFEGYGGAIAKMDWIFKGPLLGGGGDSGGGSTGGGGATTTPTTTPATDYVGKYYNNPSLSGSPVLTRDDPTIDFDWGHGSPDPVVNDDLFSASWTKTLDTTGGLYRFTVTSDDGVRLFIDDQKVLDKWFDHSETSYTVDQSFQPGPHTIRLEYYEEYGGAIAKMSYAQLATSTTQGEDTNFTAQYYDNMDLTGTPILTEQEGTIDYVLGNGSPNPIVPVDHFSASWIKHKFYLAGTYNFTLKADDGIRFLVDGVPVVDDWTDHSMKTYNVSVPLSESLHTLEIDYYEDTGTSVAIFEEN